MAVDRSLLVAAVELVASSASDVEWRLVGTASSAIRGIDLPVSDVDAVFDERAGVDLCFERLADRSASTTRPVWLEPSSQYFARLAVEGTVIELSTVEIATDSDTWECFGRGPWVHYDDLDVAGARVPTVACELRLITEVTRGRVEHITRLVEHLRNVGCDVALLERGLVNADVPAADRAQLVAAVSH